jgi:hypothetical protein
MQSVKPLEFKFRFVQNRQAMGLGASKGSASETALNLNGEDLSYRNIIDSSIRDNRLVLVLAPNAQLGPKTITRVQDLRYLVLEVYKNMAPELKKHVDRFSSTFLAESHRQHLISEGKGNLFRAVTCPHCHATVDLSEYETSSYIYCRFCGSVLSNALQMVANGDIYGTCDECHMYDRVRGYTVFNFYFLLVVYGYSSKRHFVCDACALKLAQRALLVNLLFLLGVPSAIYMWVKSQSGREPYFQDLAKANKLALKGKYQEADEIYDKLFSLYPEHPGLLMNKGLGHLHGKDGNGGVGFLTRSLRACANYMPSLQLIHRIQQASQANGAPKK